MSGKPHLMTQVLDYSELIVAIAVRKDRAAFAQLFEHFAPRIKTLMLRLGVPEAGAEELAQDTMLVVWRKAHLFDPAGASASGWIFRIARNLRIDRARRDQRLAAMMLDPSEAPEPPAEPDHLASQRERTERVQAALSALSREQLQVITLSFFEERPHGEISERLNLPLGTVKSRLRLAMKRLRQILDDVA
jgi:RNA polymerase sigma-70 factor (ECF subfamily)